MQGKIDIEVSQAAREVHQGFLHFQQQFLTITRRAQVRFERREWGENQRDARERLELYEQSIESVCSRLCEAWVDVAGDATVWPQVKAAYSTKIADQENQELARTFYNSVTRRLFTTVGVAPNIEYVEAEHVVSVEAADATAVYAFRGHHSSAALVEEILSVHRLQARYRSLSQDASCAGDEIDRYLSTLLGTHPIECVETLRAMFFRHNMAFIVGRIRSHGVFIPLVLALRHQDDGVYLDAVLMDQDDVSILFSFTRSYFHADSSTPHKLIAFVKSILPLKPVAELYISLGFHKHGKRELFRNLRSHLDRHPDTFKFAEGHRGMVMIVFTLENFDVVFKVIRDEFDYPKQHTREHVIGRYDLVFQHDRVGRLVDAQEFRYLKFPCELFDRQLLDELVQAASESVSLDHGDVGRVAGDAPADDAPACPGKTDPAGNARSMGNLVIHHVYTERKITPLNLFLDRAPVDEAKKAVIDYGAAIKELAAANIFPGDFLLKNFGVTRHGRVVFYDYDELCLLSEVKFRKMPQARNEEDELAAEPWFSVGPDDVFPDEFRRFLGMRPELKATFIEHHGDLFEPEFWWQLQERHDSGEVIDFLPYPTWVRI